MSFATYSGEKDQKEFNARCMVDARTALQKYPLISELVEDFCDFAFIF